MPMSPEKKKEYNKKYYQKHKDALKAAQSIANEKRNEANRKSLENAVRQNKPWTNNERAKLFEERFSYDKSLPELSNLFQRSISAIEHELRNPCNDRFKPNIDA